MGPEVLESIPTTAHLASRPTAMPIIAASSGVNSLFTTPRTPDEPNNPIAQDPGTPITIRGYITFLGSQKRGRQGETIISEFVRVRDSPNCALPGTVSA